MLGEYEPEKPQESDCCGNGCTLCVYDIYDQQLRLCRNNRLASTPALNRFDLLSNTCFKPFRLIEKCQVTEDVFTFKFQPLLNEDSFNSLPEQVATISGVLPYNVGQHLILRCFVQKSENKKNPNKCIEYVEYSNELETKKTQMVTHAYTPITISSQEENCIFEVFVKIYKNGKLSQYLNKSVVGDVLYWRGPYGQFHYEPNLYTHILLVCLGSGLAPMIPVVRSVLMNEADETVLHLMYGVKNINHIILRKNLIDMTQFWNFTLEYYFSEVSDLNGDLKFGEHFRNKHIDIIDINEYISGRKIRNLLLLLCGTECFVNEITQGISESNFKFNHTIFSF